MSKGTLNKVILIGRLGGDPETRYMPNGTAVLTLSIATMESYKDKAGNYQDSTEWHKVVLFGKQAEFADQYCHKGSLVYIEGKIKTSKYEDKNTKEERYSTQINAVELQLLASKEVNKTDPNNEPLTDKRPAKATAEDDDWSNI